MDVVGEGGEREHCLFRGGNEDEGERVREYVQIRARIEGERETSSEARREVLHLNFRVSLPTVWYR